MDQKVSSSSSYRSRRAAGPSCVICFKAQSIFSIGPCDHPVCYECSTTMRVLCDQKECPICRRIMTKVIFTRDVNLFKNLEECQYSRYNKKYGIAFDNLSVENSFDQLMRCICKKCYDRPDFSVFEQLATHMERNHRLYACRLCVDNLKIFPSQRRWYNYDELARHEECGDPDNTSHRGHPACHFCNMRYLDKDELYKHLRKEHFYCHFCDADGIQDYYMTYEWLRKHYHDKHYLCEEGNCINEQFTSVFRTSIDLQAHKAQTHSRDLGKQGYKEARTLKLEFNLRPRHNPLVEAGRPNQYQPPPDTSYNSAQTSDRTINVRNTLDFPSLNGQPTTVLPCARTRKPNHPVNTRDLNLFPALGQETVPPPKPPKQTNNIRMAAAVLKKPAELSRPDRNKVSAAAGPSSSRLPNQAKDFPSLDGNQQPRVKDTATVGSVSSNGSWVSKAKTANENQEEKKKAKKEMAAIKKKVAEAPKIPGPSDFPNLNKKLEPNKSNLAKLGNKKKTDNPKKIIPIELNNNNSNQNGKKNSIQPATADNNNVSRKTVDNVKSAATDNIKENNKPRSKSAIEAHCNGTSSSEVRMTKTATGKTETNCNSNNNTKVTSTLEPKKESKKKENVGFGPLLEKREDNRATAPVIVVDANNPKDKKKRKKNENREALVTYESQRPQESLSKPSSTPKIPPGFENSFHHPVRAPPGLSTGSGNVGEGNRPQSQIKAPPGLSLTSNNSKLAEYLHPVGSTIRNQMLINNLMVSLIPARDERFDTFEKFKEMSTLFRKNQITAYEFYSYCVEALQPQNFESIFPELLLLLPDIQKQQELLFIYNRNSRREMDVKVCKYCRQVLRVIDMEPHLSVHNSARS